MRYLDKDGVTGSITFFLRGVRNLGGVTLHWKAAVITDANIDDQIIKYNPAPVYKQTEVFYSGVKTSIHLFQVLFN